MTKLICSAVLAALAMQAPATNFSGKWVMNPESGRGRRAPVVLVLNQVGTEVTGSVTPPSGVSTGSPANTDVFGGKVDGDTLSFYLWTGLDKPVKTYYKGKMSGDTIVFTVTAESGDRSGAGQTATSQITAKRTR